MPWAAYTFFFYIAGHGIARIYILDFLDRKRTADCKKYLSYKKTEEGNAVSIKRGKI